MNIKYALLGFLSERPLSGYDLKKIITDSPSLYWSGNNNQIYTTLVQLDRDGLVTSETQQQEHYPTRKIYTITDQGRAELRGWVLSTPEPPQLRAPFHLQLRWADQLEPEELDRLMEGYEEEVEAQLLMCKEQERRASESPGRTPRETYLWKMIARRTVAFYENELEWVQTLGKELGKGVTS